MPNNSNANCNVWLAKNATDHSKAAHLELGLDGVKGLRPEWEALEKVSSSTASFFQSYAWCHHVASIRLARSASNYRPCIAHIRDADDCLIGLWPLSIQRQGSCQIAKNLDAPFGQFAGMLLRKPGDAVSCIAAVARELKDVARVDGMQIMRVVKGSPLSNGLIELQGRIERSDQSVYLDFCQFSSFDDYHRTVATKTRKNLRNALNRMRRTHEVEHHVTDDAGKDGDVIARTFDERLTWMELGGKTTPAFRDPDFRPLLKALPKADPAISLLGFELKTTSDAVSTQWGFRYQDRYYAYMSARNLDFDAFSPGQVHLGMVIKACHKLGIDVIELMAPPSEYKLKWTKMGKQIDDFSVTLSPKGFVYLDIWHGKIRKVLKWAFDHFPEGARRIATSLTNRNLRPS